MRRGMIAKLIVARGEIEDVLRRSAPAAHYDPVLLPATATNKLAVLWDDLDKIIRELEGEQ